MKVNFTGYVYIFLTVIFTVYGQLVLKWQISQYGDLPSTISTSLVFLLKLFSNVWILSGYLSAFLAALSWMAALTKFEVSYAYPFMSLGFILVMALSTLLLSEPFTWTKALGTGIVVCGLVVLSR